MYYILNKSNQLIAADETLLHLCEVSDIHELNRHIILETITFTTTFDTKIQIKNKTNTYDLSIHKVPLSTLLGELTLVIVDQELEAIPSVNTDNIDIDSLIIKHNNTQESPTIIHHIEKELLDDSEAIKPIENTTPDTFNTLSKEPIFINVDEISQEIGISEDDFNTFLNEYITTALDLEKDLQEDSNTQSHKNAINTLSHLSEVLHLNTIGNIINNIEKSASHTRKQHINALYDALSRITTIQPNIVTDREKAEDKTMLLDLDAISTDTAQEYKTEDTEPQTHKDDLFILDFDKDIPTQTKPEEPSTKDTSTLSEKVELDLENIPTQKQREKTPATHDTYDLALTDEIPSKPTVTIEEETPKAEPSVPKPKKHDTFGELNLSDVEPIHFDFSLHDAADELSLPESLIEEFMLDFVDQAHTETDKMLEAYKEGDLSTIQKIGHLLKGVSSNLRITTLSDTLYKIQFCENPDDLESLIKNYWGHFLAFEKQIKPLAK